MHKHRLLTFASCAILACAPAVVAQAQNGAEAQPQGAAQQQPQSANKTNKKTKAKKTHRSKKAKTKAQAKLKESRAAASMLVATDRARQAIRKGDTQQALADVNHAINEASRLPRRARTSNNLSARMVPIYTEFDTVSVIGPIVAQQRQAGINLQNQEAANRNEHSYNRQMAENRSANGSQGSANREATESKQPQSVRRPAVRDVDAGFTSVAVDAKTAADHLRYARTALEQGKPQVADAALAAVQDGVVMVSFESDMPLLKVRENLALAQQEVKNNNFQQASAALRAASNGLQDYENNFAQSKSQDVAQLRQEISSYAATLASNHANAQTKIQNWWNQVTEWMTPANNGQQQQQQMQQPSQQQQQ